MGRGHRERLSPPKKMSVSSPRQGNVLRALTRARPVAIAQEKIEKMSGAEKLGLVGLGLAATGTIVGGVVLLWRMMRGWGAARLVDEYAKEPSEDIVKTCVSRVHEVRDLLLDANPKRRAAARGILERILDRHISDGPFADAKRSFVRNALAQTVPAGISFGMYGSDEDIATLLLDTQAEAATPLRGEGEVELTLKTEQRAFPHVSGRMNSQKSEFTLHSARSISPPPLGPMNEQRMIHSFHEGRDRDAAPLRRSGIAKGDSRELRRRWASEKIPRDANLGYEVEQASQNDWVHEQYGHIATWDVREVLSTRCAFCDIHGVPGGALDLTFWDTRNVQSMKHMFHGFNGNVDVSTWDTGSVTTMKGMFAFAEQFNGDIGRWNTSRVTDMTDMFYDATAFDQDLRGWDVRNVRERGGMFEGADKMEDGHKPRFTVPYGDVHFGGAPHRTYV